MIEKKIAKALMEKMTQREEIESRMMDVCFDGEEYEHETYDLMEEVAQLTSEINLLLIEARYYPLVDLPQDIITFLEGLGGPARNKSEESGEKLQKIDASGNNVLRARKLEFTQERELEKYLDMELLKTKNEMKERICNLRPLMLNFSIDVHTRKRYQQISSCYTHGFFDACCILCRATVEAIAKKYIISQGFGELLCGKNKVSKIMSVQEILKERLEVSDSVVAEYSRICNKADNILHGKDFASGEDALRSILSLQSFLKHFPKGL